MNWDFHQIQSVHLAAAAALELPLLDFLILDDLPELLAQRLWWLPSLFGLPLLGGFFDD
jgi:hypothetical protein